MDALEFLRLVTQAIFILLFVLTLVKAFEEPLHAHVNAALLFGSIALAALIGRVVDLFDISLPRFAEGIPAALLLAMPYLMLRLVDDFARTPRWLMLGGGAAFGMLAVAVILVEPPLPTPLVLAAVLYFAGVMVYCGWRFARSATLSTGVTRRRMQSAAAGAALIGLALLLAGLARAVPESGAVAAGIQLTAIASGLAFVLAFIPPALLRHAWQAPDLREFLRRAGELPRLPDTATIALEVERGAATAVGATGAILLLWDEEQQRLVAPGRGGTPPPTDALTLPERAYLEQQQAMFVEDTRKADPQHAAQYDNFNARSMLLAPITAGERRLGMLAVYALRAPIFARSDMALVQILAEQAAVVLESRYLIDEAARVRARDEAARLKEDFLSAAAHDLRTPLTTLVAQAQLLERQVRRRPEAPVDIEGIQRLVQESNRLRSLVTELLDASRAESGRLLGDREPVDVGTVIRGVIDRVHSSKHEFMVVSDEPIIGMYDRTRIEQLLDNLVENAVKYSPQGGQIQVKAWREGNEARLCVEDPGIGIPAADLPLVFDRFHRGGNVDDRSYAGMGLGLFICRSIVEEHGGRIWVISNPGRGSQFQVALPLDPEPSVPSR